MPRAIHVFRTPDRFVAGTVGQPGNRTFYLQAVHDSRVVSVILEKQQVAVLAERIAALLVEINRRFGTPLPPETEVEDLSPLVTPVDAEFRVGTMGLGWDAEAQTVVVELLAVTDTEFDASVVLDDAEEGPDAVRVFLSPGGRAAVRVPLTRRHLGRPPALPAVRRTAGPRGAHLRAHQRIPARRVRRGRRRTRTRDEPPTTPRLARCCCAASWKSSGESARPATPPSCARPPGTTRAVHCVYKPVAGEQPLWDFPDGTLAGREFGAYLVSAALGWNIVPLTIIRDGPAGRGMLQRWVDQPGDDERSDPPRTGGSVPAGIDSARLLSVLTAYDYAGNEVTLVHADDPRLLRMAVFDVIVNNADRKGGHILAGVDGRVYGVDHGVSLHVQDKLRTVLWGWAGKPIDDETLGAVAALADELAGPLGRGTVRAHHRRRTGGAAPAGPRAARRTGDAGPGPPQAHSLAGVLGFLRLPVQDAAVGQQRHVQPAVLDQEAPHIAQRGRHLALQ